MQLSKKKINPTLQSQLKKMFLGVLVDIHHPEEIETILKILLTDSERLVILKRLGIAIYLDKGRSYENIKNNLKVSSATIATVADSLSAQGMQKIIQKIKADKWAQETSNKIVKSIRKILPV